MSPLGGVGAEALCEVDSRREVLKLLVRSVLQLGAWDWWEPAAMQGCRIVAYLVHEDMSGGLSSIRRDGEDGEVGGIHQVHELGDRRLGRRGLGAQSVRKRYLDVIHIAIVYC